MWRIGQLARMAGVSDRTLRHYDKIGLLAPAAVDRSNGYRWYGAAELERLERIRGLRRLGLSLKQIADVVDAPDAQLRALLRENVAALRRDMAATAAAVAAAEDRLASGSRILPRAADVAARRLRVRRVEVGRPGELAAHCEAPSGTLLTWLTGAPEGGFAAAVSSAGGERLALPARRVVRAVVPPGLGVVNAGHDLFDWLRRSELRISGPTVEDRLVDADGAAVTVLEVPVAPV